MTVLPAWMYGDPADVAERNEQREIHRAEQQTKVIVELAERKPRRHYGLVNDDTVRRINQQRVRELVAAAKERGR